MSAQWSSLGEGGEGPTVEEFKLVSCADYLHLSLLCCEKAQPYFFGILISGPSSGLLVSSFYLTVRFYRKQLGASVNGTL